MPATREKRPCQTQDNDGSNCPEQQRADHSQGARAGSRHDLDDDGQQANGGFSSGTPQLEHHG